MGPRRVLRAVRRLGVGGVECGNARIGRLVPLSSRMLRTAETRPISFISLHLAAFIFSAILPTAFAQNAKDPTTITEVSQPQAKAQLDKLMHDFYEVNARYEPVESTFNGDNRFDDQIGMSISSQLK